MAKLYTFLFAVCAWQVAASSPLLGGLASNPLGSVQGLLANPLGALNGGIAKNSPFFNDLKNIASSKLAAAKNFGLNALNNVRSRVGAKFGAAPAVAAEAAPAVEAAVVTAEVTPEVDVEAAIVKRSPFFNDLKNIATSKLAAAKNFGLNALNNVRSRVGAKFGAAPAVAAEAAPAVEAAVVAAEVAPEVAVDSEVDVEAAIVKRSPFFNDLKNIATSKLAAAKNFGLNALNNVRSRVGAKFGAAPAIVAEAAPAVEAAVVAAEVVPALLDVAADTANVEVEATVAA